MTLVPETERHPPERGTYVVYIEPVGRFADRRLMQWDGERWGYRWSAEDYRGRVYGWIGPIPRMIVEPRA